RRHTRFSRDWSSDVCSSDLIRFEEAMIAGLTAPLGIGIIIGLCVGKPVGILLMSKLAVKLGIAQLPAHAGWGHIAGVGLLAGVRSEERRVGKERWSRRGACG